MVDGAFGFSILGKFLSIVCVLFGAVATAGSFGLVVGGFVVAVDDLGGVVAGLVVLPVLGGVVPVFATGGLVLGLAVLPVAGFVEDVFGAVLPDFATGGFVVDGGLFLLAVGGVVVWGTTFTNCFRSNSVSPEPQGTSAFADFHFPTSTSLPSDFI
jgi:hypothetical protein